MKAIDTSVAAGRRKQIHPDSRVAVILAVYNGADFLGEQLDTLARQTVANIDIWASDDGSTDASIAILEAAKKSWEKGDFRIQPGPNAGFAENFRSLIINDDIEADFFAFCDQDDLWDQDKLENALDWLSQQDVSRPALYCTRTRSITAAGVPTGLSPLFRRKPDFRNAIVQSIAGANTMVMNSAAWQVIREASRMTSFVTHDWWCYLIITGTGGVVHYSPNARIDYRQHSANLIGENRSWRARLSRIRQLLDGRFTRWNGINLRALKSCRALLSTEAQTVADLFEEARTPGLMRRMRALLQARVYRQTALGQIALYIACALRRL